MAQTLPWTAMPIIVAPTAGALSDRINGRTLMAIGLALQATGLIWIGLVVTPTVAYSAFILPFILSGVGMGMFFAPVANVVLSSVTAREEGKASGANNAIRELGGVLGVTVLASIFAHWGGYISGATFVAGLKPAVIVGGIVVIVGALAAASIPARKRVAAPETASRVESSVAA
jgi:MFS family permease